MAVVKIIFATGNRHKQEEVQKILGDAFTLYIPADYGLTEDIPETAETLEGNASQKAWYIYERTGENCFADDTGLEVEALDGAPGVWSARYAGESKSDAANIELLLANLSDKPNRKARFRTVISLIIDGKEKQFEGIVNGVIIADKRGTNGFGYDPVFVPDGYETTFAEMDLTTKNLISHRGKAVQKLAEYLKSL